MFASLRAGAYAGPLGRFVRGANLTDDFILSQIPDVLLEVRRAAELSANGEGEQIVGPVEVTRRHAEALEREVDTLKMQRTEVLHEKRADGRIFLTVRCFDRAAENPPD